MNLLILFAFLASLSSLFKDLLKGYSSNKHDVILSIIFTVTSFIPLFIHIIMWIKRDIGHLRSLKFGLYKVLLFDYFEEWLLNRCEAGDGIYCNQAVGLPCESTPNSIIYSCSSPFAGFDRTVLLKFMKWAGPIELNQRGSDLARDILGHNCEIETLDFSDESVRVFSSGRVTEYQLDLDIINHPDYTELVQETISKCKYIFRIGNINVRYLNDHILVCKRTVREMDIGRGVNISNLSINDKVFLLCCLRYWELNVGTGILDSEFGYTTKKGGRIHHCLNVYEIIEMIKSRRYMFCFKDFDKRIYCEGLSEFNNLNSEVWSEINKDVLKLKVGDRGIECIELVMDHYKISDKFFKSLIFNKILNLKSGIDYKILSKIIGNWKQKRFLVDIDYILNRVGYGGISYKDKSIKRSQFVEKISNGLVQFQIKKVLKIDRNDYIRNAMLEDISNSTNKKKREKTEKTLANFDYKLKNKKNKAKSQVRIGLGEDSNVFSRFASMALKSQNEEKIKISDDNFKSYKDVLESYKSENKNKNKIDVKCKIKDVMLSCLFKKMEKAWDDKIAKLRASENDKSEDTFRQNSEGSSRRKKKNKNLDIGNLESSFNKIVTKFPKYKYLDHYQLKKVDKNDENVCKKTPENTSCIKLNNYYKNLIYYKDEIEDMRNTVNIECNETSALKDIIVEKYDKLLEYRNASKIKKKKMEKIKLEEKRLALLKKEKIRLEEEMKEEASNYRNLKIEKDKKEDKEDKIKLKMKENYMKVSKIDKEIDEDDIRFFNYPSVSYSLDNEVEIPSRVIEILGLGGNAKIRNFVKDFNEISIEKREKLKANKKIERQNKVNSKIEAKKKRLEDSKRF